MSNIELNKRSDFFEKNSIIILIFVGVIAILIRFYNFPFQVPFSFDGIDYFSYAVTMSQVGHFPNDWALANNGWPSFVSIIFTIFNFESFIELTYTQRVLSIIFSVLTIIPLYKLAKKFFPTSYSIIAVTLFVFEPRIINNSLLGITESFYLFLGISVMSLYLSKNIKFTYLAFGVAALFALTRYEGLLLIIPMSIMFVLRFRKDNKIIIKYIFTILVFLLIIIPIASLRIESYGQDGLLSHYLGGVEYIFDDLPVGKEDEDPCMYIEQNLDCKEFLDILETQKGQNIIWSGLIYSSVSGFIKTLFITMIPFFIIITPISILIIFKQKKLNWLNLENSFIIFSMFIMSIPILYTTGRLIEDPRFFFILFPGLILSAVYGIRYFDSRLKKKNFKICVIIAIILISVLFVEYKKIDYNHERELFKIAKIIVDKTEGINLIDPELRYVKAAEIAIKWPDIPQSENGHVISNLIKIPDSSIETIEEYIKSSRDKGLTHIVIDSKEGRADYLKEIFQNEEKFPYLLKIFDSVDEGMNYHIKIFKIDFVLFEDYID